MLEAFVGLQESPCFAPLQSLAIGSVAGVIVMFMGDFLYSRRARDQERKRRFVTTFVAVCALFGAVYFFMLAEACALGTACSDPLEVNCNGRSANVYRLVATLFSFTALAVMCAELLRQLRTRG